jgi:membrane protein YdbS with pleckstrin-like domain
MYTIKLSAIILNVLLIIMFATYFFGHGLPNNWILWSSSALWFFAPVVNLIFIKKISKFSAERVH